MPPRPIAVPVQPLPAVEGVNAKVSGFGGAADGQGFFGGAGSVTVPLGFQWGLQIDGLVSTSDSRFGTVTVAGTAGHLFWRDPAVGLLGAYGHYVHANALSGINVSAWAGEGALYLGRFSFDIVAGAQGGRIDAGAFGTFNIDWRIFDVAELSYYPTDNLRLSIGHSYAFHKNFALLGVEWGFPLGSGAMGALFASGSLSEGNSAVTAGLKVYLGQRDKTLIRRHREDDPLSWLLEGRPLGAGINPWEQLDARLVPVCGESGQC